MDGVKSVTLHDPYEEFVSQNEELARRIQSVVDRGRSHLENGMLSEARKEFQRALALYPYVPAALNNLALLAFSDGDGELARAYLQQLLHFHEAEPTANALMARYWAGRGSTPLAMAHAEMAARSALALVKSPQESDPTRAVRSLEFAFQSLTLLGEDSLLTHLFKASGEPALTPVTLLHVGIAFFNRGDFLTAKRLWERAWQQQPDLEPARVYLTMFELLERHKLLPFRLDHRLEMPQAEKGRRIWMVHVPTLFIARALERVYEGDNSQEAEEAIVLLTGVNIPGLDLILVQVGTDTTKPTAVRLLAGIQLATMGFNEQAAQTCESIYADSVGSDEQARWYLLQGLVADSRGRGSEAANLAAAGLAALKQQDNESVMAQSLRQMLSSLLSRGGGPAEPSYEENRQEGAPVDTDIGHLQLPDAEWLRHSQLHPISPGLEESLMKRRRQTIEELAGRLGEQSPERQQTAILVRRVAMRMRSVQIDKVTDYLSVAGKQALEWLDARAQVTPLSALHAWLLQNHPQTDPWMVMEEIYRSCLVDIGMSDQSDEEPFLCVAIPKDLAGRFHVEHLP
jgi:tetratricopeptide (TPR) repeat protein